MIEQNVMEKIVSLCKRRGFIFPGSEIYGGLAGTYDYGPLGVELRHNIKQHFWSKFISERDDVYGISAAILMPARVWEASGHTESFTDPVVECRKCHNRFRADHTQRKYEKDSEGKIVGEVWVCENCGAENKKSEESPFNLLVQTQLGASESTSTRAYLRGEITQGAQVNFKNILDSMHPKLPFGIGQIGKAFRNEIAPRDFLFRQREFEQMELQYYIQPNEEEGKKQFEYWKQFAFEWYQSLGFKKENLRLRQHADAERAHYAKDAWDIEYNTPFGGWKEAWGIHHRGDWDLRRHQEYSGVSMEYTESETGAKVLPWDIECSGGIDRAVLFVLLEAYREDTMGDETRVYLALAPKVAPIKAMVSPLLKNKPELVAKAKEVRKELQKVHPQIAWDDNGNIGKRYRRQDEIGTPFCITIDFDTLGDPSTGSTNSPQANSGQESQLKNTVTLRHRDTGLQERLAIEDVKKHILAAIS